MYVLSISFCYFIDNVYICILFNLKFIIMKNVWCKITDEPNLFGCSKVEKDLLLEIGRLAKKVSGNELPIVTINKKVREEWKEKYGIDSSKISHVLNSLKYKGKLVRKSNKYMLIEMVVPVVHENDEIMLNANGLLIIKDGDK